MTRRSQGSSFGFWIIYLTVILLVVAVFLNDDTPTETERRNQEVACIDQGDTPVYHPETHVYLTCETAP